MRLAQQAHGHVAGRTLLRLAELGEDGAIGEERRPGQGSEVGAEHVDGQPRLACVPRARPHAAVFETTFHTAFSFTPIKILSHMPVEHTSTHLTTAAQHD